MRGGRASQKTIEPMPNWARGIGLRYYAFVFSGKIQSIRLNPRGQRLNPISAEGHFLACLKNVL